MSNCPNCEHHKETARLWRQEAHKEWVGLTNDEIMSCGWWDVVFARAIEAKLKEKNT